ncbi:hypothetical protein Mapa_010212 [Marchantia paleacea]|nr:hypothetical protein Mapa_010212 [Marchantia paleacea]
MVKSFVDFVDALLHGLDSLVNSQPHILHNLPHTAANLSTIVEHFILEKDFINFLAYHPQAQAENEGYNDITTVTKQSNYVLHLPDHCKKEVSRFQKQMSTRT